MITKLKIYHTSFFEACPQNVQRILYCIPCSYLTEIPETNIVNISDWYYKAGAGQLTILKMNAGLKVAAKVRVGL